MVSHWRVFQRRERWSRKAPDQIWARTCVHTAVYHSGCSTKGERGRSHDVPLDASASLLPPNSMNWSTIHRDFPISYGNANLTATMLTFVQHWYPVILLLDTWFTTIWRCSTVSWSYTDTNDFFWILYYIVVALTTWMWKLRYLLNCIY